MTPPLPLAEAAPCRSRPSTPGIRGPWISPPKPFLGVALAVCLCLGGVDPLIGAEVVVPPSNLKQEVTSLFIHGGHVEAVTRRGFYEAERKSPAWHVMTVPASMPPGGQFATGPEPSGDIYYYTTVDRTPGLSTPDTWIHGLYRRSTGKGRWELMSGPEDFHSVLVHSNVVFAVAGQNMQTASPQKVLRSTDQGRTWQDLSANQAPFGGLRSLFPDPDHPGQVCLRADGIRPMIWQASNSRYQWQEQREIDWIRRHPTALDESGFFAPRFTSNTQVPMVQVTLENFFELPREDFKPLPVPAVNYPGLAFSIGGARTFSVGSPIVLPVELQLRTAARVGTLVDWPDEIVCWGLRRLTPDGKSEVIGPRAPSTNASSIPPVLHPLTRTAPYRRVVNLNALAEFREPGKYRVQLIYSSYDRAKKDRRQWPMEISGPVIDLELKR